MLYPIQNNIRNIFDLSGIWDFQIDPDGIGEQDGWFNGLTERAPDGGAGQLERAI